MSIQAFGVQSPKDIAEIYAGDKGRIAEAAKRGYLDLTVAVLAGIYIDRMRNAAQAEQSPQITVAQQVLGEPLQGPPPMRMAYGGQVAISNNQLPSPAMERGLDSISIPDNMFDYADGGMVAFAEGGFNTRSQSSSLRGLIDKMSVEDLKSLAEKTPPRLPNGAVNPRYVAIQEEISKRGISGPRINTFPEPKFSPESRISSIPELKPSPEPRLGPAPAAPAAPAVPPAAPAVPPAAQGFPREVTRDALREASKVLRDVPRPPDLDLDRSKGDLPRRPVVPTPPPAPSGLTSERMLARQLSLEEILRGSRAAPTVSPAGPAVSPTVSPVASPSPYTVSRPISAGVNPTFPSGGNFSYGYGSNPTGSSSMRLPSTGDYRINPTGFKQFAEQIKKLAPYVAETELDQLYERTKGSIGKAINILKGLGSSAGVGAASMAIEQATGLSPEEQMLRGIGAGNPFLGGITNILKNLNLTTPNPARLYRYDEKGLGVPFAPGRPRGETYPGETTSTGSQAGPPPGSSSGPSARPPAGAGRANFGPVILNLPEIAGTAGVAGAASGAGAVGTADAVGGASTVGAAGTADAVGGASTAGTAGTASTAGTTDALAEAQKVMGPARRLTMPTAPAPMTVPQEKDLALEVESAREIASSLIPLPADADKTLDQILQSDKETLTKQGYNFGLAAQQIAEIRAEKEKIPGQKKEAVNLRLLEAGLAIMGGSSPYAFVNIGKGASEAAKGFNEDMKEFRKLDREYRKELQQLQSMQNQETLMLTTEGKRKYERIQDRVEQVKLKRAEVALGIGKDVVAASIKDRDTAITANEALKRTIYQTETDLLAKQAQLDAARQNTLAQIAAQVRIAEKPAAEVQSVRAYANSKGIPYDQAYREMAQARQEPKTRAQLEREFMENTLLQMQYGTFENYMKAQAGGASTDYKRKYGLE